MDIYVGIAVVVLVIVVFAMLAISLWGIKEKSYEEALAEQREATSELLGGSSQSNHKSNKTKEKKQKKAVKANKKKPVVENVTAINKMEPTQSTAPVKHHVEFKEADVVPETIVEAPKKKVQQKNSNDKVRPILVHRQDSENNDTGKQVNLAPVQTKPEPLHHQPITRRDSLELLHTHAKQDCKEVTASKAKKTTSNTQKDVDVQQKEGKKTLKQGPKVEVSVEKEIAVAVKSKSVVEQVPVQVLPIISNTNVINTNVPVVVKEKKKKNNAGGEKQLLQQHNGLANMASLFPLVHSAELTRSEVQTFIDMLLNKQLEAPSVLDEWSEGRADPLQKLKRQLIDVERQLEGERDAKLGLQQKLVILREELNTARIQGTQRVKVLEESLLTQQQAALRMGQQFQQMQAQISDGHKVRDDYAALQRQHNQLEIRATQVAEVEEVRTKKLLADSQEMQAVIAQLRMDVCNVTEQLRHSTEKRQLAMTELTSAGMDLVRKDEVIRELEQTRMNMEHQHKADFNQMQSHLQQQNEEIRRYEFNNDEMQKQRNDTDRLIDQLRGELSQAMDQSVQELRNLQNEQSSVRGQLTSAVREHKRIVDDLHQQLEQQKQKNNELETKSSSANEAILCRKLVERLYPNLELSDDLSSEDIMTEAQVAAQTNLDELDRSKTTEVQLQTKIERLQGAILDSETVLKNLFVRLGQEEIDWRSKLNEKDAEINRLIQNTQEASQSNSAIEEDNATLSTDDNVTVVNSTNKIILNAQNICTSTNGPAPVLEETNGK